MLVIFAFLVHCSLAFQVSPPSSFVGRSVLPRRHVSCPPIICMNGGSSVPPIIQRIFAKQQQNDVEKASTVAAASVVDPPTTSRNMEATNTPGSTVLESTAASKGNVSTDTSNNDKDQQSDTQKMMQQVKDAGLAGIISYALWEIAFWAVSVPVCVFGYRELTGHWPDFQNAQDMQKLGAEAFAFVNFARFAVPLRIGLALSTTPWMEENVVEVYFKKHDNDNVDKDE
eukprot:CAMPEP_0202485810 /NCGR_PEP_ID=MMETSP1361-20130828/4534_1 /ASSEMBLY_ACC=CAM_ASM_000849 /TAXON_ID=210615 /ORGANISM="Staurosira complex sp., Strain CCMP2646" /LENGTH=227 /DNA_ID=CAMNT_0049114781 /DNA_START=70 /DNA_END=753 /DNA_ORIENTATION=+